MSNFSIFLFHLLQEYRAHSILLMKELKTVGHTLSKNIICTSKKMRKLISLEKNENEIEDLPRKAKLIYFEVYFFNF